MKFVRAIWKLLVGIKDALVLIFMLLFFGMLYSALSARPAPVKDGVLDLNLNGAVVEQPSRASLSDVAGGNRLGEYRLPDSACGGATHRAHRRAARLGRR